MLQPDARPVNSASGLRERQARPASPIPAALVNIPIILLSCPRPPAEDATHGQAPPQADPRRHGPRQRRPLPRPGHARGQGPLPPERPRPRPARPRPRARPGPRRDASRRRPVAAYRREFPAPGPCARDLAEALAAARLRAARADRLEAELLAGLAEGDRSLGRSFHDDPDTRAALALVQRYRREAELSASRARRELEALARARAAGLLADEEEAAAAEADLDAASRTFRTERPRIERIEPVQRVRAGPAPAADDAGGPDEPEPRPDGEGLLAGYRYFLGHGRDEAARYWLLGTPAEREAMRAAAEEERRARAEGRDPESLYAAAEDALAP